MCNSESPWKTLFTEWPADMPRRGIMITSANEQIPFSCFMTSEHFVLFSRNATDSLGARTVLLRYESLAVIKITDVVKSKVFESAGFEGQLGRQ